MSEVKRPLPMQSVIVATKGDIDVLTARGAGAPGAAMLECLVMVAPRTLSAKRAGTPGMRRFLNSAMRSADGTCEVTAYGEDGREVVTVACSRVSA